MSEVFYKVIAWAMAILFALLVWIVIFLGIVFLIVTYS